MSIANADLALYDDHSDRTVLEHLGADDREVERWGGEGPRTPEGRARRPGTAAP